MRKGPFPPPQTPPLFSKPFTGIYLFAPQKDKCHSNFEKYLNAQVYMSFFTTYPHWEQSLFQKLSQELLLLKPQKQFLLVCCKIMYNVATQQLTRRSREARKPRRRVGNATEAGSAPRAHVKEVRWMNST